ncbi:hypothetical protein [Nocardioides sp.]|uniref:hypothetical protein n=1 Tax=Nocardioides sp. TaxID=35761 RepID=UPI0035153E98
MSEGRRRRARPIVGSAVLLILLAGCGSDDAPALSPPPADTACDVGDIRGTYLYEVQGAGGADTTPYLEVGLLVADGRGGVRGVGTGSRHHQESTTRWTLRVEDTCRATLTPEDPALAPLEATLAPGGEELTWFVVGATGVTDQPLLDGAAERVDDTTQPRCDSATLTGTYLYRARGEYGGRAHVEQGFEVYNGDRVVTNAFRVAGSRLDGRLLGEYQFLDDCHAVVVYENGQVLHQYVSPDGERFNWIQTDGFSAPGYFGGTERRVSMSTEPAFVLGGVGPVEPTAPADPAS